MEDLKNEVVSSIRSCLISTKGKISLRQLEDDYRTLLGSRIPYSKFGHKSLESFLSSVPSLVLSKGPNGQTFVDAQISEKTAHISLMVQKQKTSAPKKKSSAAKFAPRFTQNNRYNNYSQPPSAAKKWKPKNNYSLNSKQFNGFPSSSSKLANVSHNQFISGYNAKPQVASRIVVPPGSGFEMKKSPVLSPIAEKAPSPKKNAVRFEDVEEVKNEPPKTSSLESSADERLSSARKRISKIMSELSLDRDSGNSSPTTEYATQCRSLVQEFVPSGDAVTDLKNFAQFHKLGDVDIKFTETKPKKAKISQFHCKIKVGKHLYSSYPNDFFNPVDAERYTAQKALDDLIPKHSRRRSLLISSNDDIVDRIPPMLEKHQSAIWMWQIEADYIERFNEQLPSNWLQVIDSSPFVSIEKCPGGYVLKHCNPDDILQKGKKIDVNLNTFDVSVPCNTTQFSDQNRLYAIVISAPSAFEIWCQQYATPEYEAYYELMEAMTAYYSANRDKLRAKNIHVNSCYAILDESGSWIRVRALSCDGGYVDCFSFDNGRQYNVSIDDVYLLRREFAVEQAQAFVCRLIGLEELYDFSTASAHISDLEGREFVLEMTTDESDADDLTIPIVLYDAATGDSVNEALITLLTLEMSTPVLNENSITEVHLSNIESDGDCFVQIHSPAFMKLMEMMETLEANIKRNPPSHLIEEITQRSCQNRMFLYKSKSRWVRVKFVDWSPHNPLAQIYFVDYGNVAIVNLSKDVFYPLDKIDNVVSQYPAQAIKVRIMIENLPNDFVQKAQKFMPNDQAILLKIISRDNENVAWVEFFKRSSDGGLFCINKSIVMEAELQNIDSSNNNDKKLMKLRANFAQYNDNKKNVPSGGSLSKPNLPGKGQYLNVKVPFAVNPWNFFVQPLDSVQELTTMMADMQEYYNSHQFSPLQMEDVIAGKIYASKHDDGSWYRTSVLKVIHSTSISVFYCDFGYYTNLTLRQLVPLDLKYMSFPYQALKAKLAGIKPSKNKWTMEDCEVFKNLVTARHFVSVLIDIEKDELYRSDNILKLHLIDTTGQDDVHIKQVLIDSGIAIDNLETSQ